MLNSLRALLRKASSAEYPSPTARIETTMHTSTSADGTTIYRGLDISSSSYRWDSITAEHLGYWINRLPHLRTPFLAIAKPRPGVEHPEFVQTYWESGQEFTFEWWNYSRPGLHRVCTVRSAQRLVQLIHSWLDGDDSQLESEQWAEEYFKVKIRKR